MSENHRNWLLRYGWIIFIALGALIMSPFLLDASKRTWGGSVSSESTYFLLFAILFLILIAFTQIGSARASRSDPRYEKWRTTATEMGLVEKNGLFPIIAATAPVIGNYRNHQIIIWEPDGVAAGYTPYMEYDVAINVEFENPSARALFINKDKNLEVKGNNESNIRTILDTSIRDKIMRLGNVSLEIRSNQNETMSARAKEHYLGVFANNFVRYITHQRIENMKKDAERFKYMMDIMIDIVEKIEQVARAL